MVPAGAFVDLAASRQPHHVYAAVALGRRDEADCAVPMLKALTKAGHLEQHGAGRGTWYGLA